MRKTTLLIVAILALYTAVPALAETTESLPTPFTAEQIRDAWPKGLRVVTLYETPEGKTSSTTTVTEWSKEGMTTLYQELDAAGAKKGESSESPASWAELRDHALFPAATTKRERTRRETAFGKLEGWLYKVSCGAGCVSEFFFADIMPGPPVIYSKHQDGERQFLAEVIERSDPR